MLTDQIKDLITAFTEMRKQPGLDKKSINKTIASLEVALLWSEKILTPGVFSERISLDSTAPTNTSACTCLPGVRNLTCPIHHHKSL